MLKHCQKMAEWCAAGPFPTANIISAGYGDMKEVSDAGPHYALTLPYLLEPQRDLL